MASTAALREHLAQEAARLMIESGIRDYALAKRKAARRLGVRGAWALPGNAEVDAKINEWQRIFEPETHRQRLRELRHLAVEAMHALAPFHPRLAGPVLTGAINVNSPIELHVFSDAPENVAMALEASDVTYRDCQRRYRYNGRGVTLIPGYRFSLFRERVEALVFPEKGLRQAPMSPVDGRPMPRAGRTRVLGLLGQPVAER